MNKNQYVDFSNTKVAFSQKSNRELKRTIWLFRMMSHSWLIDILAPLSTRLIRWKVPLVKMIVKSTIFRQFVGGETLKESLEQIDGLARKGVLTILDYGAEGKSTTKELDLAHRQFMDAITFAASHESVVAVCVKISALSANELLMKLQDGSTLTTDEKTWYNLVRNRLDTLCASCYEHQVKIFIDAEESWIQDTIDALEAEMMVRNFQSV